MWSLSPKGGAILFVLDIVPDDAFQQGKVHRFLPLDAEEIACLAISRFCDDIAKRRHSLHLWGDGKMLLGGAESNDKRAVVGKHWLVPGDFRRQRRKSVFYPGKHFPHPGTVRFVLDFQQIFFKDFHVLFPSRFHAKIKIGFPDFKRKNVS